MLSDSPCNARGEERPATNTPLTGLIYATPIALALWALIALAAIKIF